MLSARLVLQTVRQEFIGLQQHCVDSLERRLWRTDWRDHSLTIRYPAAMELVANIGTYLPDWRAHRR